MDKTVSNLNQLRQLAGIEMRFDDQKKTPTKQINEGMYTDSAPKGAIQHVWIVAGATPDSELHDVINLTDIDGMIKQILGMFAANREHLTTQQIAIFPEGAKAAAMAEAKRRIKEVNIPSENEEMSEMDVDMEMDVDVEDKPSTELMRDTAKEKEGYCEKCDCDPCECEERDDAAMDDLSEAAEDESQTAPDKKGVNVQNEVGKIFKGTWNDKNEGRYRDGKQTDEPATNMSDEGGTHPDGYSLYPMDAKRQTMPEENEETIKIPAKIKSALNTQIKELEKNLEEKYWHDEGTALLHGRAAHWMREILEHLDGSKEGFKWAQIHYTSAMGPIKQLMPDDVRTWIARGGREASLKSYMSQTKDRSW